MKRTDGLVVRHAVAADADVIARLNCALARETENRQLDVSVVLRGVRRGLTLPGDVQYLIAERAGDVVGQLMLTREWSDWRDGWIVWLQSVYVAPESRRRGVFRRLFEHALDHCRRQSDVVAIRLYVENHNKTAQATYFQLGFEDSSYQVLERRL